VGGGMKKQTVDLIAAELGWGAKLHATALGPEALKKQLHIGYQKTLKSKTPFHDNVKLSYAERVDEVAEFANALAQAVSQSVINEHFPIVIGGDHAMAIGTWSGVVLALHAAKQFGLIWVDAHMDSHTTETTPSMAIHGMPLAALLGYGEKALTSVCDITPKLDPKNVVLIGVRSYESGEAELLKQLNVKIYFMEEVKKRGFADVLKEAIAIVSNNTLGFGVSIDLDAFDPAIAPGVGSPENDGIIVLSDIKEAFNYLLHQPALKALEIAEYNPTRDIDNRTVDLVNIILKHWI